MRVLLIGGGGRERALAWRLASSEKCTALFCAPGNPGIGQIADLVDIKETDNDALVAFAKREAIDLVVVGPEGPLCNGLADDFAAQNIAVFGPRKSAAVLEGSKAFMKDFCAEFSIPTAAYGRFTDVSKAQQYIRSHGAPIVLKTDGLAAGKGVLICDTVEQACEEVSHMLSGVSFGAAGQEVVIEEFLDGEELSFFAIADGKTVLPFTSAQDHKRVGDGDTGLNTGGMGAYSPAHLMTQELQQKIMQRIILPTVQGMKQKDRPYTGVLYAGIMVVHREPYLIEYNVRFGDPECQVMLPRLGEDMLDLLYNAATGNLSLYNGQLSWSNKQVLTVVMASKGYPESYEKGSVIKGLDKLAGMEGIIVFHAGTVLDAQGQLVNAGGRVLNITAGGENIGHAKRLAYEALEKIDWPQGFYRRDIGWRAVAAQEEKKNSAA